MVKLVREERNAVCRLDWGGRAVVGRAAANRVGHKAAPVGRIAWSFTCGEAKRKQHLLKPSARFIPREGDARDIGPLLSRSLPNKHNSRSRIAIAVNNAPPACNKLRAAGAALVVK